MVFIRARRWFFGVRDWVKDRAALPLEHWFVELYRTFIVTLAAVTRRQQGGKREEGIASET